MPIVARKLYLAASSTQYTIEANIGGGNAATSYFLVRQKSGAGTFTGTLEGSLDRVNYSSIATISNIDNGYNPPTNTTGIGYEWLRMKIVSGAGLSGTLDIGIFPTKQ